MAHHIIFKIFFTRKVLWIFNYKAIMRH